MKTATNNPLAHLPANHAGSGACGSHEPSPAHCGLAKGFTLGEKLWAQLSFLTMVLTGTVGIALADWPWVFPYLVIYNYGIFGVVMRHLACPRCPHLQVYNDCLQAPRWLAKRLIKKPKRTPMSRNERNLFRLIFILIPLYPLFWLGGQPLLLAGFLVSAMAWYGGQVLRFCKQCRIKSCPFNRAARA